MKTNTHSVSAASQFSHELRIPLTGILGMAHFLEKTRLTPEQKRYLSILQNSAEQLLGLVKVSLNRETFYVSSSKTTQNFISRR
jgi:signal transduction histidine kinase